MILELKKISKRFKEPAPFTLFKEIDLAIEAGEKVAITGPSGEGKSTLLHIAAGLEEATSGKIKVMGEELTAKNSADLRLKQMGFVFQSFHLIHGLTLLENLLIPARIAGLHLEKRASELIEKVGLKGRRDHPVHLLSGGEQQRAAIARALMLSPALILADEPTGNLDHANSEAIQSLLLEQEGALLVVTHSEAFAAKCERQLVIENGALSTGSLTLN